MNALPLPARSTQLATFDLLDEAGCEDWVLRVLLMRRHWRQRHALAPFFTLGLAAYLDCVATAKGRIYDDCALRRSSNALLDWQFAPLLQVVAAALSAHFSLPAELTDAGARPGFHIYLPHPAFAMNVAKVHRDLQYRDVFPGRTTADDDLFSFTLPLSTPSGSGLNLWTDDAAGPDFIPYRSGRLVVHSGLMRHQAVLDCDGDLERITLQGHGIRLPGQRLLLYW
ncbi:hypothetical protein [Trinickia fusca]|uniref:Fe2OG dioxygenase domain-containing protein n=1 Tax=Trinickia fusca TaxID=2419777 RepID=A0A494XFZ9_9BURK|nr:hypothetical protein [Trinickia fusca]RKP47014.1 hypothetical protein D7S89_15780 [Trinickia fusca]